MKISIEELRKKVPAKTIGCLVVDYTHLYVKKISLGEFIKKCPFKNVDFGMEDGPEKTDAKGRSVLYTDYWFSFKQKGHTYSFFTVCKSVINEYSNTKVSYVYPTKATSYNSQFD